jgi:hypothetical protein
VPEDVVQILERVQIEQEHRDGWFCVAAVCDLPLDRFVQRPAVAQAGELVAERSRMRVRERLDLADGDPRPADDAGERGHRQPDGKCRNVPDRSVGEDAGRNEREDARQDQHADASHVHLDHVARPLPGGESQHEHAQGVERPQAGVERRRRRHREEHDVCQGQERETATEHDPHRARPPPRKREDGDDGRKQRQVECLRGRRRSSRPHPPAGLR